LAQTRNRCAKSQRKNGHREARPKEGIAGRELIVSEQGEISERGDGEEAVNSFYKTDPLGEESLAAP